MGKEYVEERNGGYYVADTRVSLDSVVYGFKRGESPETIRQQFSVLTLEEVYGAITFYLANKQVIEAYLVRQEEKWEEGRRNAEPIPEELRQRLMRAREELRTSRSS